MSDMQNPAGIKPADSKTEYEIPSDTITLPSRGLVYPKGSPMYGLEEVELQYLTAIQEDIITSPNLISTGKMIPTLLKSVIRDRNINVDDLILGDRNTMLIWLRSTGYGKDYPVKIQCKDCGHTHDYEFDLSALEIKELEVMPDEDGLFSFSLPLAKKIVRFKFMTGKDELEIMKAKNSKRKKLNTQIDNSLSLGLFKLIKEVDGIEDPNDVRKFVTNMIASDARAFRTYMQKIEPGMIMLQDSQCPACGEVNEEVVPIGASFFWPDSDT